MQAADLADGARAGCCAAACAIGPAAADCAASAAAVDDPVETSPVVEATAWRLRGAGCCETLLEAASDAAADAAACSFDAAAAAAGANKSNNRIVAFGIQTTRHELKREPL